jgi:hypothetical protein
MRHRPTQATGHRARPAGTFFSARTAVVGLVVPLLCSGCKCSSEADAAACKSCCIDVASPEVRSCDLVLDAEPNQVITFGNLVRGSTQQIGTRLGVTFAAREDKALSGSLVNFAVPDGGVCSVKLTFSGCYDKSGKTLENAKVNFRGAKL